MSKFQNRQYTGACMKICEVETCEVTDYVNIGAKDEIENNENCEDMNTDAQRAILTELMSKIQPKVKFNKAAKSEVDIMPPTEKHSNAIEREPERNRSESANVILENPETFINDVKFETVSHTRTTCCGCGANNQLPEPTRPPTRVSSSATVRSASGSGLSQSVVTDSSMPMRKTSLWSSVSLSGGSDENEAQRKLDLRGLIESVGTLLIPTMGYMNIAFQNLLSALDPSAIDYVKAKKDMDIDDFDDCYYDVDKRHLPIIEAEVVDITTLAAEHLKIPQADLLRSVGEEYFRLCLRDYDNSFRMVGSSMVEFFSNLDGLQTYICSSETFQDHVHTPSFRCDTVHDHLIIHIYTNRRNLLDYFAGVVTGVSKYLFNREAIVTMVCSDNVNSFHHILTVDTEGNNCTSMCQICRTKESFSTAPSDLNIGVATFCTTFPFHLIFDRDFTIVQMGTAISKYVPPSITPTSPQAKLTSYFEIVRPSVEPLTFSALLSRINFTFCIRATDRARNGISEVSNAMTDHISPTYNTDAF